MEQKHCFNAAKLEHIWLNVSEKYLIEKHHSYFNM